MKYDIKPLFYGFPAQSGRGFLGWSSVILIQITCNNREKKYLYDTGGYNERIKLLNLLKMNSIKKEDIDGVIISHLHFDHAVNWTFFPKADIFIHQAELYPSAKYEDLAVLEFHKEQLLKCNRLQFVSEIDCIDGMQIIDLPGHTEGLIGLKIENKFLVSDAIKNRNEINKGDLTNTWDVNIAKQSIMKVIENAGIIFPGHDVPLVKENN